jgi:hypothetical protein
VIDNETLSPCSTEKVRQLLELFDVPVEARGPAWNSRFYEVIPETSLSNPDPKIFYGPDLFPYFHLQTPQEGPSSEAFCLVKLLEYLTTHGLGAAINPTRGAQDAEWVFSYGDILCLRMFGSFQVKPTIPPQKTGPAQTGEQVLVAAPSESLLPGYAREVLRRFMNESLGVAEPGVLLLSRSKPFSQQLVFSIFPEDYTDPNHFQGALRSLRWFLPRHYELGAISSESPISGHFTPLKNAG